MKSHSKQTKVDLSIIIPAYREAERIGGTLKQIAGYLKQHDLGNVEVAVVANSHDPTAAKARAKARLFRNFHLVDEGKPVGKGKAVAMGMQKTSGSYKLFMDADLATPLHHLQTVSRYMKGGSDVIIGVRDLGKTHKGLRKFISSFGNLLVRLILRLSTKDTQCGFKAFRREVAQDLFSAQTIFGWGFDIELLAVAKARGYSIQTIAINDWRDVAGGSFANVATQAALSTFRDILKIKWQLIRGIYKR
ncbi:glycosyltransferase [Candidatus Microgenomates bacterium]|nr:glycosyltransferase [Candidatus Microgenomates bacterium]